MSDQEIAQRLRAAVAGETFDVPVEEIARRAYVCEEEDR
jgi:hypothetical protein